MASAVRGIVGGRLARAAIVLRLHAGEGARGTFAGAALRLLLLLLLPGVPTGPGRRRFVVR
jgi:hypothetical protein